MSITVTLLALSVFLGLTLVLLAPFGIAALIAWSSRDPLPRKRLYVLICGLLSYGSLVLAAIALVPIKLIAVYLAPQWQIDAARASDITFAMIGIVVAIVVPLRLRIVWPAIAAAAQSARASSPRR
jgi:hypothetical protein